jgi:hypothetical protein
MKTLNEQYQLIKEGKGHKGVFLKEAKSMFPNYIRNAATFDEVSLILKQKGVINENIIGLSLINSIETKKESFETAFEKFLAEAAKSQEESDKATAKTPSKQVEEKEEKTSKPTDKKEDKNFDNMIFDQIMTGYYAEMKDPKNKNKTMQELKDIVLKNLSKDPIYYVKDGQFGVKSLGYTTEHPGLGTPKEAKGKYKSSGYGDLKENKDPREKFKSGVKQAFTPSNKPKPSPEQIKADREEKRRKELERRENEIREAIRSIVDQELEEVRGGGNYGILTINTSNLEKGEQKIPTYYILTPEVRKAFNLSTPSPNAPSYNESLKIPHIRVTPNNTIFISNLLYITLEGIEKGRGTREKQIQDNKNRLKIITNEISDRYWPMIRALFKKFAEPKTTVIPTFGKNVLYHEIRFQENGYEVEKLEEWIDKKLIEIDDKLTKATSGEVRRGRPINVGALQRFKKQLEDMKPNAKGGIAIIPPPMFEGLGFSYKDKEKYAPEELEEQLLRKVIRESVEKELSAINKEAESEVISTKLEKIDAAIEKRQSQLNKLDEDEDMKALTDKTKIKQAQKDIKTLEKAKAKLEKDLSKIKKKNKDAVSSDIIDEDAPIDEAIDDKKLDDTSKSLDDIGKKIEDISTKTKDMFENEGELPQNIINQVVEMFADVNGDSDEIINIASNFPEYEESVVEFLEGYDLGLDYDI